MVDEVMIAPRQVDADLLREAAEGSEAVFVDFDYTLFECNSTELFIASCKPGIVAAMIDFAVRRCIPWRLVRAKHAFRVRDYVCCLILVALTPWNAGRWRRIAPDLFARHQSTRMAGALQGIDPRRLTIITFGLHFIVAALLRGSHWQQVALIATPTRPRPGLLMGGKLGILNAAVGATVVARSTFITDSVDDADVLTAVRRGVLVEPQGALFSASEHLYVPFRYTARAKYTRSYLIDQLVLVELALLVISISRSLVDVAFVLPTAGLLYLSLMCVYEIGYFENDMEGARLEARPRVSPASERFRDYPIVPAAWIWAGVLAGLGVGCMLLVGVVGTVGQAALAWLVWAGCMAALRLVFHLYNGRDLTRRLYLYPVLQALKFLPVLILMPPSGLGAVILLCHVAVMWAIYLTYRLDGRSKDAPKELYRVVLLAIAVAFVSITPIIQEAGLVFQLAALGVWAMCRLAKAPILQVLGRRH